jgi:hypothetical protein
MIDIDKLEALAKASPAGRWEVWTSNSWRRVYANQGREQVRVIEPAVQHDRWPDLMFGDGVAAWLEGVTPDVVVALIAEVRALRERRNGPGSPTARLHHLIDELDERFPDAIDKYSSAPQDHKYLDAIDAAIARGFR